MRLLLYYWWHFILTAEETHGLMSILLCNSGTGSSLWPFHSCDGPPGQAGKKTKHSFSFCQQQVRSILIEMLLSFSCSHWCDHGCQNDYLRSRYAFLSCSLIGPRVYFVRNKCVCSLLRQNSQGAWQPLWGTRGMMSCKITPLSIDAGWSDFIFAAEEWVAKICPALENTNFVKEHAFGLSTAICNTIKYV